MRKNFNSVQMLKSSDDCNKFSKSVSYETLVGGTATIGSECGEALEIEGVITRRTSVRRGYLPEKCIHANEESLFASVTWLMRLPRRIQRMLLVMTIPVLALIFTFATTAESRADDATPVCKDFHGEIVDCIDKLTDTNGNNSCGDNCSYKVIVENGEKVLHIYKTDVSKSASIREGAFSPYYYADNTVLDANGNALPLNNIMLDNDFENLGSLVFTGSNAQISSASGKLVFNNSSGYNAFRGSTVNADVILSSVSQVLESGTLNGDVIISDGVNLTSWMFTGLNLNGNMIIPSSVTSIPKHGLLGNINGKIYCAYGVDACYDMLKSACGDDENCLNKYSDKLRAYPDGCEKLEANLKCTKCKNENFKLNDGECDRLRYTPAEASKVLHDDNTNEIVITFKK